MKTFKDTLKDTLNPALNFISHGEQAPEGYKRNPRFIETKSARLQLLIQPSLKAKLQARAAEEGTSVNDLVHSILKDYLG